MEEDILKPVCRTISMIPEKRGRGRPRKYEGDIKDRQKQAVKIYQKTDKGKGKLKEVKNNYNIKKLIERIENPNSEEVDKKLLNLSKEETELLLLGNLIQEINIS